MNGNRIVITEGQLLAVRKEFNKLKASFDLRAGSQALQAFESALRAVLPQYVNNNPHTGSCVECLWGTRSVRKRAYYFNLGDTYDVTIIMYRSEWAGRASYQLRLGCWGNLVEAGAYA